MTGFRPASLAAALAVFLLAGCLQRLPPISLPVADATIELDDTPFFPQTRLHCGPAALSTVLAQSGVDASADSLADEIFTPGLRGSLREELLASARRNGRIPVMLDDDPQTLVDTLAAAKPVLVLQNLGSPNRPYWHYAVLIGYQPDSGRFLLRSGRNPRRAMSPRRFLYAWEWAGKWAVVLLAPGESIPTVSRERYLAALGAVEETTGPGFALAAFQGAIGLYPDSLVAWAGYGNAAWRAGDPVTARKAFEQMLSLDPGNVAAHNNLANVYLGANCRDAARSHADRAGELLEPDSGLAGAVAATLAEINAMDNTASDACEFGDP